MELEILNWQHWLSRDEKRFLWSLKEMGKHAASLAMVSSEASREKDRSTGLVVWQATRAKLVADNQLSELFQVYLPMSWDSSLDQFVERLLEGPQTQQLSSLANLATLAYWEASTQLQTSCYLTSLLWLFKSSRNESKKPLMWVNQIPNFITALQLPPLINMSRFTYQKSVGLWV